MADKDVEAVSAKERNVTYKTSYLFGWDRPYLSLYGFQYFQC